MSNRLFEPALRGWLEEGSDRTPQAAIDAVLLAIKTTPQERDLWIPRRFTLMPASFRLAAIAAVIAVAGAGAMIYFGGAPSPADRPSSIPTIGPTPSAPIETSRWRTYTSEQYGFTIGRPDDWIVFHRAERAWAPTDRPIDLHLAPYDTFTTPANDVAVGTWAVPLEGDPAETFEEQVDWVEDFCRRTVETTPTAGGPCDEIRPRATSICLPQLDGLCGVIVEYDGSVYGFVADGEAGSMTVVLVWRPEDDPTTKRFGGSTNLLKAFLETLSVARPSESAGV